MAESQEFAVNFAKLCLLVNVGRINTTIACELPRPLLPFYFLIWVGSLSGNENSNEDIPSFTVYADA